MDILIAAASAMTARCSRRNTIPKLLKKINQNCPAEDSCGRENNRHLGSNKRTLEPSTMHKIAIGLSALLVAASQPGFAQNARAPATPNSPTACVTYEPVEFPTCLKDEVLTEEQARTARGHPQFFAPHSETLSRALEPGTILDGAAHASGVVPSARK